MHGVDAVQFRTSGVTIVTCEKPDGIRAPRPRR